MTARHDLDGKLVSVSGWVRQEFDYIDDLMCGIGADTSVQSGPGRVYRVGGTVVLRSHPKTAHLALGFPNELRGEVQELTLALREQQRNAWLNYAPGVGDRETITALIDAAVRATAPAAPVPDADAPSPDLTLLLSLLRAFKNHELATSARSGVKVLREAIFLHWEAPRLPAGGRYSVALPHSPNARAQRTSGVRGGLVFEHVHPVSLVIRQLLADVPADEHALATVLERAGEHVVITREEDAALTAAGYRNAVPVSGEWGRYAATGLRREDFAEWRPAEV